MSLQKWKRLKDITMMIMMIVMMPVMKNVRVGNFFSRWKTNVPSKQIFNGNVVAFHGRHANEGNFNDAITEKSILASRQQSIRVWTLPLGSVEGLTYPRILPNENLNHDEANMAYQAEGNDELWCYQRRTNLCHESNEGHNHFAEKSPVTAVLTVQREKETL